ncbi:Uncharacterized protein LB4E_1089 [Leptospira borgpetersenii str. 4E]|nr:Uncharacterized protein LB4E_1089 [Leptospira borgpetersenii str. 4E]
MRKVESFKERYRWAFKKEKSLILDEFVEVTGFETPLSHKDYASSIFTDVKPNKSSLNLLKQSSRCYITIQPPFHGNLIDYNTSRWKKRAQIPFH